MGQSLEISQCYCCAAESQPSQGFPQAPPYLDITSEILFASQEALLGECDSPKRRPSCNHMFACELGTKCNIRTTEHLNLAAHPFDPDYVALCTRDDIKPEEPSLWGLFQWVDTDGTGKLSRKELLKSLPLLSNLFGEKVIITQRAWENLDEDGNGIINFSEFACWAGPRLGLPLGVKHLFEDGRAVDEPHGCAVLCCPCEAFVPKSDGATGICACCKHKSSAHDMNIENEGEVQYPFYWDARDTAKGDFTDINRMSDNDLVLFQKLIDSSYLPLYTSDRKKHNPKNSRVPARFEVVKAYRSENSRIWREYGVKRAQHLHTTTDKSFRQITDVLSSMAWVEHGGALAGRLKPEVNEWYLFHGTNECAAENICKNDFRLGYAGTNTGTLYGRGIYFAESITKADEYAVCDDDGIYTVLLTRVVGGQVNCTDEIEPDHESLVESCISGQYDCIIGDRRKTRGTYREFVFYDTENFYAEYIIKYKRIY